MSLHAHSTTYWYITSDHDTLNVVENFEKQGEWQIFLTVIVKNKNDPKFNQAKLGEIDKLVKMGTYRFVPRSEMSRQGWVLQSRFVLSIKNHDEPNEQYKARIVILGHADPD